MGLNPPVNLNTKPKSSSTIFLTWANGAGYNYIEVWENRDGAGYVFRETGDGERECYYATGLDTGIRYCYRVLGGKYDPPEESDLSIEDCSFTFATLEPPSDLKVIAFSNFIEIIWKDNSSREDDFRLWRKVGAEGGWAEYATIPANMDYYRDTSVTPGTLYTYRVLARHGEESSDPSNEDSAVALSAPSIPTKPTLSEVTNKEMRFSWTAPAADEDAPVTGYKVQISDEDTFGGEETEYIVGAGVLDFLFRNLTPNDTYYARVCAYNGVEDSSFTASVNDKTDEQYESTEFEEFIRKPGIKLDALCEMNLGTKLAGFTLTPTYENTYELAITDRVINDIDKVYENGEEYTEKTSIDDGGVEATASSFWFNTSSKILYIHTSTGLNPSGFYIEGRFCLHIKSGESATFNDNFYLPLLSLDNIPSMSSEVSAFYGGSFTISAGTISLKNDEKTSPKFFDKRYADYLWRGGKLVLKIGGPDFTYEQYKEAFTSLIDREGCTDKLFTLSLMDLRANLEQPLPMNKYWLTDYPDMDEDQDEKVIPKAFGYEESIVPACTNKTNKQWKFHDTRIKEVHMVKVNDVEKTKDADYYVDYQRAIITFDESVSIDWEEADVEIHFTGTVNSANESVVDGTEIFRHIMIDIIGLSLADLDHDSIYQTKYTSSIDLAFSLRKEEGLTSIIHKLENSVRASTFQDEKGRIGLQTAQTVPASNAVHVENFHIAEDGHSQEKGSGYLFKEINVFYKEYLEEGKMKWEVFTKALPEFVWKYGKKRPLKSLDIYTYFYSNTQASALADDIATKLAQLEGGFVDETLPWVLYGCRAGDLIKLSKDRFFSELGKAEEITMRLLKLDKMISSKQSKITGVVIG
ncbi:hypothetical protein ES703_13109 [subsurface metagenome]